MLMEWKFIIMVSKIQNTKLFCIFFFLVNSQNFITTNTSTLYNIKMVLSCHTLNIPKFEIYFPLYNSP